MLDPRGLPTDYLFRPEWEVTPRWVRERVGIAPGFVLVDVRTEQERELARIEGAVFIPLHELEQRLDDLRDLDPATIVVHCHHGMRSLRATAVLRAAGFPEVHSMAGGIDLWAVDVDRRVGRY